ncbi:hypothetical protein HID58_093590 [Brassica napus]|uniref:Uncharacterized protein n=1 Tax=Brassica napus TaxID=3708 RepID=A0ABQ7XAD5_BRANA|nr:hypothetical protein HID58_093598 [Brassica napus]KAH0852958.1 hypothetical protein HID58_093590 [Brassica napus]
MRSLNRDMYGDLPGRVKQAYEELCARQTEAMQNPQTSTFEAAADAWEHWHHISGIEEQFYYQKSRVQWLGELLREMVVSLLLKQISRERQQLTSRPF